MFLKFIISDRGVHFNYLARYQKTWILQWAAQAETDRQRKQQNNKIRRVYHLCALLS
jgi:hypothetical protein